MSQLNLTKVGVSFLNKTEEISPKMKEWNKITIPYLNLLQNEELNFFYIGNNKSVITKATNKNINVDKLANSSVISNPRMIWIPCMDERIQYLTTTNSSLSLGLPGCECLLSNQQKIEIANEIVSICKENKEIEEIVVTSHDHCGAVQKTIQTNPTDNPIKKFISTIHKLDKNYCDKKARTYSQSFARILNDQISYNDLDIYIHTLHMATDHMHCPHFHNTVGSIINFSPEFSPSFFSQQLNLPLFNIFGTDSNIELVIENIKLAIQIAQSDHGFNNEFFNEENPFILLFPHNKSQLHHSDSIKKVLAEIKSKKFQIPVAYSLIPIN